MANKHIDFSNIDYVLEHLDEVSCDCEACLEALEGHMGTVTADNTEGGLLDDINFAPSNFVSNLGYMGSGMLGIFIVIALIMTVTTLLNKVFSGKKNAEEG